MGNGLTRASLRTEIPEYRDGLLTLLDFALLHCFNEGIFCIKRPRLSSKL